jgi:hypothetical protein
VVQYLDGDGPTDFEPRFLATLHER